MHLPKVSGVHWGLCSLCLNSMTIYACSFLFNDLCDIVCNVFIIAYMQAFYLFKFGFTFICIIASVVLLIVTICNILFIMSIHSMFI